MSDISAIKLPSGTTYNIKDKGARELIPTKTSDIDNDSGFIISPNVVYCTCSTAKGTAAKVATIVSGTLTSLNAGDQAIVKFTYHNTSSSPTLKIGNTTAKSIMRYGTTTPSTSADTSWNAGSPILFVYDGTYWVMCGYLNSVYSEISEANITNASGSAAGLVTGRRVKKAVETFAPVTDITLDGTSIVSSGVAEFETVTQLRDGIMSATDKQKLDGIESGAEANVQSDWDAVSGDAQILNKPSIPANTSDLLNDSGFLNSTNFVVEEYTKSYSSMTSGATFSWEEQKEKQGYYPIGVVGFMTNMQFLVANMVRITDAASGSCWIRMNARATANLSAGTARMYVLWVKEDNNVSVPI